VARWTKPFCICPEIGPRDHDHAKEGDKMKDEEPVNGRKTWKNSREMYYTWFLGNALKRLRSTRN